MNDLQVFQYNNSAITFQLGDGDVMVNATEMAKPFGKEPASFLRNAQTQSFVTALQNRRPNAPAVVTMNGGNKYGTWMHQKLALKFAAWLSPEFELWVYDRIEELLKHGMTATSQTLEDMILSPDLVIGLASKLKEEREEKRQAQLQASIEKDRRELAEKVIKEQAPMVLYASDVLKSNTNLKITQIAAELGLTANRLNKDLHRMGIQHKVNGVWVLYAKYQGFGYTKTETTPYIDKNGKEQSAMLTVWTEKGREFIHGLYNQQKAA